MADFVTVGEITLHYRVTGPATGLPLIFLNSLGTDLRLWDKVLPNLAGRLRLIRYDKRGHGLSDCPPGPYTIRDHTADLAGLLEWLAVDQAILIGMSVGGMIALDYAGAYPERVNGLVLCDTAAKIGSLEYWQARIEALRRGGLTPLAETILERWFAPNFAGQHPADYRGYHNLLTRTPLAGYIATCEAIRDADLRTLLPAIRCPALVIGGAADVATPPDLVRGLAEALPQARFALIEQAGHLPSLEQAAALANLIQQFIEKL
jgi:3-oxoadipate enol-lactonase